MKIYTLKIVLRGISPLIWRRLKVPGPTSLADLHYIIQTIYGWDDENLHQFHIYGKDYGINYAGGMGYSDNARTVYLDDFAFDEGDKFTYEYNFFEHWMHDIRIERINESTQVIETVSCTKGSGMPGADKFDEIKIMAKLLKMILDKEKSTPRSDMVRLIDKLHTSPELRYLETKWASLMSYGLTAKLLQDVLPVSATQNAATVRNHLHEIAQRQEDELIGKPDCITGCPRAWGNLPKPDKPITVGIDGGYLRNWHAKNTNFEVIAGKSYSKTKMAKRFGFIQRLFQPDL